MMSNNTLKNINISELVKGMFVEAIVEQAGHLSIKTRGLVRTQSTIENLKKAGVQVLKIDLSRSQHQHSTNLPTTDNAESPAESVSMEEELGHASALYDQTKTLQKRLLKDLEAGRSIDLEDTSQAAEALIDSIFRNEHALSFVAQMKSKDEYLYQHGVNCATLMTLFGKHIGIARDTINKLAVGALLADVGKIHIPNDLISKPEPLNDADYEIVKQHVDYSWEIASSMSEINNESLDVIAQHHERLDGSGYPKGLRGEEISLFGRMMAIVDTYEAMTSNRPHKDSVTALTAYSIMKKGNPGAYDNDLLNQFIRCIGVYPVGTLVKLRSGKLGIVLKPSQNSPLKPVVNIFYNARTGHYQEQKIIDLARYDGDEIESAVRPEEFKIDLIRFFRDALR